MVPDTLYILSYKVNRDDGYTAHPIIILREYRNILFLSS